MMFSQGLHHKTYPWEESIRVPLLVRYPRRFGKAGRRARMPFNSPDMLPTLLGLSGLQIPDGVQGTDHSKALEGAADSKPPASAFLCLPVSIIQARTFGFSEYRGVRTERHTYVRSIEGPWLLYDNLRDPYQMNNLCGKPEAEALRKNLEGELHRWLEKLDDHFLPGADYLRRDGLSHYLEPQYPVGHMQSPWGDWSSTLEKPATLSVDSFISELLANAEARGVVDRVLPGLVSGDRKAWPPWTPEASLRVVHGMKPELISEEQFQELERALKNVSN